jgi:hypothetical protein
VQRGAGLATYIVRSDRTPGGRRPLADVAEGMIRSCIAWFGDRVDLDRQDLDAADGRAARFTLRTAPAPGARRRAAT